MKRARIMLVAVAVIGIIGGAAALQARTPQTFFSTDPNNGQCTVQFQADLTTTVVGVGTEVPYSTGSTISGCDTYVIDND